MSRPGFVLEVDERTPPLVVRSGTGFRLERFSVGTRVVYCGDGEPARDPYDLTAAALANPHAGESLASLLKPGMKLTITLNDRGRPTPRMRSDVRQAMLESVLELVAAAGVDDVVLLAANGLRRKLIESEFEAIVGERVFRSFAGGGLRSHDAEDPQGLASLGMSGDIEVLVNRRVAESDLVVHVAAVSEGGDGSAADLGAGLGSTATIDALQGLDSAKSAPGVLALISSALRVFTVQAVLGHPVHPAPLGFLNRREWEWSLGDRANFLAVTRGLGLAPAPATRLLYAGAVAEYPVLEVVSGPLAAASEHAQDLLRENQLVTLGQPADVLVAGVGAPLAQAPDAPGNPLAAAAALLGRDSFGLGGSPSVRKDGALIAYHPLGDRFGARHHSAGADFFADVLPVATQAREIRDRFQERFTQEDWYLELYRNRHAFHPLLPFHEWYSMQPARDLLTDIVWVGADRRSAELMGFRAASTLADALEIVSATVGRRPSITVLHSGGVQIEAS